MCPAYITYVVRCALVAEFHFGDSRVRLHPVHLLHLQWVSRTAVYAFPCGYYAINRVLLRSSTTPLACFRFGIQSIRTRSSRKEYGILLAAQCFVQSHDPRRWFSITHTVPQTVGRRNKTSSAAASLRSGSLTKASFTEYCCPVLENNQPALVVSH